MYPGRYPQNFQPGSDPSSMVQYPGMYYKSHGSDFKSNVSSGSSKYSAGDDRSSSSRSLLADSYERIRNEVRSLHQDSYKKRNRSPSPDHYRSQKDRGHSVSHPPHSGQDNLQGKTDPLSMLLDNKNVTLSSLLEAAMNPSSPGSSKRTEDPIMKKTILNKCEGKIAQLYRHRINGLGTFFPLITQAVTTQESDSSGLMFHHPRLEFNMEPIDPLWTCPEVSLENCVETNSEQTNPSPRKGTISPALEATEYSNKPLPPQNIETVTFRDIKQAEAVFIPQYSSTYYNQQPMFPMNAVWPPQPVAVPQNVEKDELQMFEDYLKEKEKKKKKTKKSRSRSRSRGRRKGRSRSRDRKKSPHKSRHSRRSRSRNRSRHRRSRSLSLSPSPRKTWKRSPSPQRSHHPPSNTFNTPQPMSNSSHSSWNPPPQPSGIYGYGGAHSDNLNNDYQNYPPYSTPPSTTYPAYNAPPRPYYFPPQMAPPPQPFLRSMPPFMRQPVPPFVRQCMEPSAGPPPPPGTVPWNTFDYERPAKMLKKDNKRESSNLIHLGGGGSSSKEKSFVRSPSKTIEIIDDDEIIILDASNDEHQGSTTRSNTTSNSTPPGIIISRDDDDKSYKSVYTNAVLDPLKAEFAKRIQALEKVLDTIRDVQRNSFDYSAYIKGLETTKAELDGSFTLHDKILCRLTGTSKDRSKSLRIVVPDDQTMNILGKIHLAYHEYNTHKIHDMIVNLFYNDRNFSIIKIELAFEACETCHPKRRDGKFDKNSVKVKGGDARSGSKDEDKEKYEGRHESSYMNKRNSHDGVERKGHKPRGRESSTKDSNKKRDRAKTVSKLPRDSIKAKGTSTKQEQAAKQSSDKPNENKPDDKTYSVEKVEANEGDTSKTEQSDETNGDVREYKKQLKEVNIVALPVQSQSIQEERETTVAKEETTSDGSVVHGKTSENSRSLDFKYRVRQAQMNFPELATHINCLEGPTKKTSDPNLLLKAGMLCRRFIANSKSEVKIVVNSECLADMLYIVHTMAATHAPVKKTIFVFNKHFTQIEDVDKVVSEIVNNCEVCNE